MQNHLFRLFLWGSFTAWYAIITARKRSLGQDNIFIGVCQEFCSRGGGVCLSACWDTPSGRHSPGRYPSLGRHPSPPPADGYCCGLVYFWKLHSFISGPVDFSVDEWLKFLDKTLAFPAIIVTFKQPRYIWIKVNIFSFTSCDHYILNRNR